MENKEQNGTAEETKLSGQDMIARRTAKDSVFCDLFGDKKYLLQMYQELHPEDTETTEADLTDVTIRNVLTDGIYNDIGFRNKDRVVILTESQSTWSMNILVRMLLYMAETYHSYFMRNDVDLYASKKASVPEPELYVIFTGERKDKPEYISLSEEFFQGKECSIEVKAKVLYGNKDNSIISQYIAFSKVYTEQVKLYGYTRKAVMETIRICMDRNILAEYLKNKESEVISIMMSLFDEEYIQRAYHKRIAREAAEEAAAKATKEAEAKAAKAAKEAEEASIHTVMESAEKMLKAGRIKPDEISEFFPQLAAENIKSLLQAI